MRTAIRCCLVLIALAGIVPLQHAAAQVPPGSDTISARAAAESLKVLDQLGRTTKSNPRNADALYRRGMIAFALAERTWEKDTIPFLNYRQLRLTAADALLAAVNLDPKNRKFILALSQFHLTDRTGIGHSAVRIGLLDSDADLTKADPDTAWRVQRLLDAGWVAWLDYDGYANRAMSKFAEEKPSLESVISGKGNRTLGPAPGTRNIMPGPPDASPFSVRTAASNQQIPGSPPDIDLLPISSVMMGAIDSVKAVLSSMSMEAAGEADYLRAEQRFRAAYTLAPTNNRAYRCLAMLFAERDNWTELEKLARDHTQRVPQDPWGWMTLALANYRLKPGKELRPAFESALARLDPKERDHLDRFERILSPKDSATYVKYDSATKANITGASWLLADPLWSTPQADPRVEFLARLTFAELRWSVPEQHAPGADTPRGKVFIRYGPPNKKLGYQPPEGQVMFEFWMYNADIVFAFIKILHTGAVFTAPGDDDIVYRVEQWQPARWDNIATSRIDSMPTQVARFRTATDSVDMFLATRAPLEAMRGVSAANARAFGYFWLYSRNSPAAFTDTVTVSDSGALRWTRRVQPGPYYYRVESAIPGVLIAGRTTATVMMGPDTTTGFATRGFGLSDILLATRATSSLTAQRWTDFTFTPVLGSVAAGSQIALLWETYELGKQNTDARYDVAITIERQRGKDGRIAAQIVSRVAGAVGMDAGKNKVEMHFERTAPHAAALADNISIALGATPPGTYRITVQITDRVSRRVASRATSVVIQ